MHTAELLRDVVLLLAASLPIVVVFQRIRVPALVGFLIAGILIGPSATGLIRSTETADVLAEIGVVLLLFTIGVDFAVSEMSRLRRFALVGGGLQVASTIGLALAAGKLAGLPTVEALVVGFLVSLSSTAIALKVLGDRIEMNAPHGQAALGILLFQDLCVLPMMLLLPVLSRPEEISLTSIARVLGTGLLAIVVVFYAARFILPAIFRVILRLRIRELFIATVVVVCLGTAWLVSVFGVSLAIGAFLAGLVISESEYSHQVVAEILPFRDLFNSIFFISVGMLLDVGYLVEHFGVLLALTGVIVAAKGVLGSLALLPVQPSGRVVVAAGLILAQMGEFSIVLGKEAAALGNLSPTTFQMLLSSAVLSMVVSPFVMAVAPRLTLLLFSEREGDAAASGEAQLSHHVVIIGYGLNGQNLARVLRETGLKYCILELNAESVREAAGAGEPIRFGDATRPSVLRAVNAGEAAVVVVAISDPVATRRIVSLARGLSTRPALIVRTRYVSEIEELYKLGADEVVPEEFETSVEIFARVLQRMHVPRNVIDTQIEVIRAERYAMLRGFRLPEGGLENLGAILAATTIDTYRVRAGSRAVGQSLRDIDLRGRTGVTVIALIRGNESFTNPPADLHIATGDVLVMLGAHAELVDARLFLDAPAQA